jgi:hypothetical protein
MPLSEPGVRYRALLIGNNDYEPWPDLKTAINDVERLAEVLQTSYGFAPADVRLLKNATRRQILSAFQELQQVAQPEDRVLIYYAGHGHLEESEGYWVPVDGRLAADAVRENDWLSNRSILRELERVRARHKFLIADSCFSGSLLLENTRGLKPVPEDWSQAPDYLREKLRLRSVIGLSSGGNEPVSDGLPRSEGHSIFAYHLLAQLRANARPYLSATELGQRVRRYVANDTLSSLGSLQTPLVQPIANQGHQGGEFFFVRSEQRVEPNSVAWLILPPENLALTRKDLQPLAAPLQQKLAAQDLRPPSEPILLPAHDEFDPNRDLQAPRAEYALVLRLRAEFRPEITATWQGVSELSGTVTLYRQRAGRWRALGTHTLSAQKLPLRRWDPSAQATQWGPLLEKYVRTNWEADAAAALRWMP